jgi:hypothetical protein
MNDLLSLVIPSHLGTLTDWRKRNSEGIPSTSIVKKWLVLDDKSEVSLITDEG